MEAPPAQRQDAADRLEPGAPVEIGQVVAGKYRVERVIARGGAGVVVKARHLHLLEPCAIKFMLPKSVATPMARERFLREARACARLKGDHVVRVFDVGELDGAGDAPGTPYMVLEYLEGFDLQERLVHSRPLPVAEAVEYVLQVCAGLGEAHALGIVHRDLKPGNVFLSRMADGATRVKILDFGISKDLYDAPDDERTGDGILVGSPLFMAPEQVRADRVDIRTDLWAVGVILYHALTGAYPFRGERASETMAHILHRVPPPPSQHVPSLPPEIERIVLQCLEKDPARRPATAAELAARLVAAVTGEAPADLRLSGPLSTQRLALTTARPAPPEPRRRWLLPAAIGGVSLALGAVLASATMGDPQRVPQTPPVSAAGSGISSVPVPVPENSAGTGTGSSQAPTETAAPDPPSSASAAKIGKRPSPVRGSPPPAGGSRGFDLGSRH
jgi:serine/threonine-protein kinase